MLKQYIALQYNELSTTVTCEGKQIDVNFTNPTLYPSLIRGTFSTTDPKLQKAIEEDSGYGIKFTLYQSSDVQEPAQEDPDESTFEKVEEVTSAAKAKEYLLERFPDDFKSSDVNSKAKAIAAARGKNILFPNLG
jgi:hypothetical protein